MEMHLLKQIVEAALLASTQPLTLPQLSNLFGESERPSHSDLAYALALLQLDCESRGVELVEVASGFRYQVRQDIHAFVARLWTERPSRYSRALLETLSLIAYRQPITRAEIEQIRGVAVSTNIVRTLEEREWVRVIGYRDLPGKPALLGTTRQFLDYFNLKSLDQLPPLSEIREIEELDPQLTFGPVDAAIPAQIAANPTVLPESQHDRASYAMSAPADESSADPMAAIHDESHLTNTQRAASAQPASSHRDEPNAGTVHLDTSEPLV